MHVLCTRLCVPKFQSCRVHAVCVCDQAEYFYGHIDEQLKQSNLLDSEGKQLRAVDIVDIIDGYKGNGYSVSTEEELGMIFVSKMLLEWSEWLCLLYSINLKCLKVHQFSRLLNFCEFVTPQNFDTYCHNLFCSSVD